MARLARSLIYIGEYVRNTDDENQLNSTALITCMGVYCSVVARVRQLYFTIDLVGIVLYFVRREVDDQGRLGHTRVCSVCVNNTTRMIAIGG